MDNTEEFHNTINELDSSSATQENPDSTDDQVPKPTNDLQNQLDAKAEEAQGLQDKYLRLAAEFENYKRLSLRDQREQIRFANEDILKELLTVIDNLERAIRSGTETSGGEALVQGVELTLKQGLEMLGKFGVRQIAGIGQPFDPACHQAVAQVESDQVAENSVVEEFQRGYYLHDRVLRAAMVSVAIPPASGHNGGSTDGE